MDTKTPNATKYRQSLKDNPAVSYWLKRALDELENRDPVDAINDIEALHKFCSMRLADVNAYYG